jgi:exosortase/archaeosortase family protein
MAKKSKKSRIKKLIDKNKNTFSIVKFIVTYVVLMGGFFALLRFQPVSGFGDLYSMYESGLIASCVKLLNFIGLESSGKGSLLFLPNITFDVRFGCNGLEAVLIYAVAVISFPAKWLKKTIGITAGFIIIQVINLLRIVGLAFSGVYYKEIFDLLHIYIAQGIMIAVALGVFLIYIYYLGHGESRQQEAA